ncbi:MAG: helix-turn-helix domain-containing protein [Syntrophales bacterium]|nr:helix-turn-helix domain-containing protein [Syntrophales bacterium]
MGKEIQIATVREVAAFLRLKEGTVCSLASQGKLPGFKLGKSWRFNMGRIERLLAGVAYVGKDRPDGDHGNTEREE